MSGASKKLMSAFSGVAGPVEAQAIDFDGTNDYLSRSTDLVGNTNGNTVTHSFWVYFPNEDIQARIYQAGNTYIMLDPGSSGTGARVFIYLNDGGGTSGSNYFSFYNTDRFELPGNTWNHVVYSVNTSTNTISFAINDKVITNYVHDFNSSAAIDFTQPSHYIMSSNGSTGSGKVRLSNVFLDYTYRNLSVEANRRLFITDEGTPASGQASLSPILYLPMDDPAEPGRNDGTGGNFTLNGIVARSGRGPNQYNAAASTFDGSADYLIRNPVTGMSDSKVLNVSFNFKMQTPSAGDIFTLYNSGGVKTFQVAIDFFSGSWRLYLIGRSSGAEILFAEVGLSRNFVNDKWQSYSISLDMANPSNRLVYIDGIDYTSQVTFSTYTNALFNLDGKSEVMREGSNYVEGELSDLWFNTTYIDLSTNNPFYDTETNKPKFLGEFGELPTGSAPLIYLPLRADDAGNNKGTGGDFTVNSGPYVGARGPSEFWAESINGDSVVSTSSAPTCSAVETSIRSGSFYMTLAVNNTASFRDNFGNKPLFSLGQLVTVYLDSLGRISIRNDQEYGGTYYETKYDISSYVNSSGWGIFYVRLGVRSNTLYDTNYNSIAGSVITSASGTFFPSVTPLSIGRCGFPVFVQDGYDFSQEARRNIFVDQLGYPNDLLPAIEAGDIPAPLIYLRFDNPSAMGTNSGTGGDFAGSATSFGSVKG